MKNSGLMIQLLRDIGVQCRDEVLRILREQPLEERIKVHTEEASDVIYAIDHQVEQVIVKILQERAGALGGIVLIAEGIGKNEISTYPAGLADEKATWRVIMDPIDGTRGLMYNKRSAFFLAGAAPNRGPGTRLSDVQASVMVELPTSRSLLADILWAERGRGCYGLTENLVDHTTKEFRPRSSGEESIEGGFIQVSRFFSPGKEVMAEIEEELMVALFPKAENGRILAFEDQYVSSGGQLYEMLTGKDRLVMDLRGTLYKRFAAKGKRTGHTCHPYDMAAVLIGTEAGIILTDAEGREFDAPMDTNYAVDWIGYCNSTVHEQVHAPLTGILWKHGLIE